jgi:hypothetical protein
MRELVVYKPVEAAEPVAFATPFVDGKATTAAAAAQSSAYALAESTLVLRGSKSQPPYGSERDGTNKPEPTRGRLSDQPSWVT